MKAAIKPVGQAIDRVVACTGSELWPPLFLTVELRSSTEIFSLVCTELRIGLPSFSPTPPPSFRANSASISVTVVFQQPLDAQRILVENLLVGLQRHDDVAVGLIAFLPVADEIGDEGRRHVFVIAAAAGIEIAVLLDQLERIGRPVLAAGLTTSI